MNESTNDELFQCPKPHELAVLENKTPTWLLKIVPVGYGSGSKELEKHWKKLFKVKLPKQAATFVDVGVLRYSLYFGGRVLCTSRASDMYSIFILNQGETLRQIRYR